MDQATPQVLKPRRGRPPKNSPNGVAPPEGPPAPTQTELAAQEEQQHHEPGGPVDLASVPRDPAVSEIGDLPLFSGATFSDGPAFISVYRLGPVAEGMLGKVEPTATEADIKQQWGGGTYRLEVRSHKSWPMKNGIKQIVIAGEPIFQSEGSRAEYARLMRNQMQQAPTVFAPAPAPAPPMVIPAMPAPLPPSAPSSDPAGLVGLFAAMITAQGQQTQAMMTLMMSQAQHREESQMRMFELMRAASPPPAPPADPLALMKEGIALARRLSGSKEDAEPKSNTLDKVIEAAPKLMAQAGDMIQKERALKQGSQAPSPAVLSRAAIEAAYEEIGKREDVLLLEQELGLAANKALAHIESLGVNPAVFMSKLWLDLCTVPKDTAMVLAGMVPPAPAAAPATPPPAPVEVVAEAAPAPEAA